MSIMLDEAQAYENSRDYDCCQIVEGACTVGDAIYEAYCAGREAPPRKPTLDCSAPPHASSTRTVSERSREACSKQPELPCRFIK